MTAASFGGHVQRFFTDYVTTQRDLSPHTLASYRDAIKLFLAFASCRQGKPVLAIGFADLSPELVLAFLEDLETTRSNTIRTRNVRLAALHTFFRYVAAHEPELLGTCQRICAIPFKRTTTSTVVYLDYAEVQHILGSIDRSTPIGRRDYLLVLLLFETGARAQEMASLRTPALRLSDPPQARLLGKGRKERVCPFRKKTAALIRDHLRERGALLRDEPLFLGVRGEPLTRFGILRSVQPELGVHHATVVRVLGREGLRGAVVRPVRATALDPYKAVVADVLAQHPRRRATRLHAMLQARGYPGGVVALRRYVRAVRPRPRAEAYLRLQTLPGEHYGKSRVMLGTT